MAHQEDGAEENEAGVSGSAKHLERDGTRGLATTRTRIQSKPTNGVSCASCGAVKTKSSLAAVLGYFWSGGEGDFHSIHM